MILFDIQKVFDNLDHGVNFEKVEIYQIFIRSC